MRNLNKLKELLGSSALVNEPLSKHTFLKIGGPADIYIETETIEKFKSAIVSARENDVSVTIIGQGSNLLVSDKGIRGLVLVNKSSNIEILNKSKSGKSFIGNVPRWESDKKKGTFKYEFKDLDYDETDSERIKVKMDSGVDLPYAMSYLISKGITGLQWYSGIPGTIGGAVFNNIHGGTHFMSEILDSVEVLDLKNKIVTVGINDLGVDYDKSRFQTSGEIILTATYKLFLGDRKKAEYVVEEWGRRKSIQPRNAPGCAFHNLTQEQKEKLGLPTTSAGFIIEHLLKMTGFAVGDAAISLKHHNFIVNNGKATAKEYLSVMKEIYARAKKELGIKLVPEIFFMGFDDDEISEFKRPEMVKLRKTRNKEIRSVYKDSKKLFRKK